MDLSWEELNTLGLAVEGARDALNNLEKNLKTLEVFVAAAHDLKGAEMLAAIKREGWKDGNR